MQSKYKRALAKLVRGCIAVTVAAIPLTTMVTPAHAAVTAVSFTGTDFTSSSLAVGTTTTAEAVLNFTTAAALDGAVGDTIVITLAGFHPQTDALANTDLTVDGPGGTNCGAAISPAAGAPAATEIGVTFSNNVADTDAPVITLTLGASVACNTGDFDLDFATGSIESSDTAGNYGITIDTSQESGGGFVYVGDENDVQVQAQVTSTLAFAIRESDDSADLGNVGGAAIGPNLCDLGTLTTLSTETCAYRLKVSTNATNGYYVSSVVDDDLNNAADSEFLDNTASGSAPVAGTEGYNILLAAGAASEGGAVNECDGTATGDCLADGIDWSDATGTIFNHTSSSVMFDVAGPNNPGATDTTNTALVTHTAAIDSATPAGVYNQLVTYTVAPVF